MGKRWAGIGLIALVMLFFAGTVVADTGGSMGGGSWGDSGGGGGGYSGGGVSVLRVAVDGRARKFVQTELARIASIADTSTDEGRASMLREVAMMLRKLRDAWVYGGAINHPMRAIGSAKAEFDKAVDDA